MNGSTEVVRKQQRISVIYLWWIIPLAFRSSSADCFVTSTRAASTTPNSHRHFRYLNPHETQNKNLLDRFSPSSSVTTTGSSTSLQVAWIPSRGGSSSSNMGPSVSPVPKRTAQKTDEISQWTKIRRTVFPIHGQQEVTKFLLIGAIKFFIILALTLTRDTKDTLIVTQCGAEAIAFLKVRATKRHGMN